MKMTEAMLDRSTEGELVAAFGGPGCSGTRTCTYELRGGSGTDLAEAREWISLFFHEAVIREGAGAARVSFPGRIKKARPKPRLSAKE